MPVPAEISQLVELFERNYDQYRDPAFTEAAVRQQFIDPFSAALGWDVNNAKVSLSSTRRSSTRIR